MLKKTRGELIGEHLSVYGDDPTKGSTQDEVICRTLQEGSWRGEILNYCADGNAVIVDCRTHVVKDDAGTPFALCGISTDITYRKQAEEELRKERDVLKQLMETSPAGITFVDAQGNLGYANVQAEKTLGLQSSVIKGRTYDDPAWKITDANGAPFPREQLPFEIVRRTKAPVFGVEHAIQWEDGTRALLSINGAPLLKVDGSFDGMVALLEDVTERKRAEAALLSAKQQAESASRAKSEFLANMSHEIRTPLNGIMGMLQVLQMTSLDEEQGQYVTMATKATKRLSRLLSDILDLSKIEADKMELSEEEFLLSEVMESIQDIFSHAAQKNGNTLRVYIEDRIPLSLMGDATRLTQILFNLVGNATKYTLNGTVDVQTLALSISSPDTCRILFRVEDSGLGIPENRFHEIFEAFSQVNTFSDPHTRQYEGAGLGLPLVKRIVDLMGGNMAIASEEGKGTTVYVSLEFQLPESRQWSLQIHESDEDEEIQPLKVLVVDDDEVTRLHMSRLLEKQKLTVRIAENGERALEELARTQFDCVLMDVQMPVLDGVETTKRIRSSRTGFQKVPIIALTAYAMSGDRETFLQAGMDDYIAKPVEGKELITIIKRNIENITG